MHTYTHRDKVWIQFPADCKLQGPPGLTCARVQLMFWLLQAGSVTLNPGSSAAMYCCRLAAPASLSPVVALHSSAWPASVTAICAGGGAASRVQAKGASAAAAGAGAAAQNPVTPAVLPQNPELGAALQKVCPLAEIERAR